MKICLSPIKLGKVVFFSMLFSASVFAAGENNPTPAPAVTDKNMTAVLSTENANSFSDQQKKDIEKIVHDYLVAHPQVLMEATQALQQQEEAKTKQAALSAIHDNKQQLFNNPASPILGKGRDDIILVEFYDYQCSHCKTMQPILQTLYKQNKGLKIVFKELPIFGDSSFYAARASLAAMKQNKFNNFHKALFAMNDALTVEKINQAAQLVGIDMKQLQTDMNDKAITQELTDNLRLAQSLQLVGTPAFVIANKGMNEFEYIPGTASQQELQNMIDKINNVPKTSTVN